MTRSSWTGLGLLALVGLLVAAPALAAPSAKAKSAELEAQEKSIIAQLDALDRRLNQLKLDRRTLAGDLRGLSAEEKAALAEAQKLQAQGATLKSRLKSRLQAVYLHGQTGLLRVGLTGPSLPEAALGQAALARMIRFDLELIEDYNKLQARLDQAEADLAARRAKVAALAARLDQAEVEVNEQRQARSSLLLQVDQEKQALALAELNQAAAALNRELAALEGALRRPGRTEAERPGRPRPGTLSANQGRLPWPAAGRLSRMGEANRKGVLILSEEGQPVKAIWTGRVVHAGWVKGYGLVVIVDHGERYYTLTAHLEENKVQVGQEVKAGDVVGYSGRAGLAQAGVYFEIRHQDKSLDPTKWLAGAAR